MPAGAEKPLPVEENGYQMARPERNGYKGRNQHRRLASHTHRYPSFLAASTANALSSSA